MANLAFELGFDWAIPPVLGVRDGVYQLQLALVNDDEQTLISPYDVSELTAPSLLRFRIYDFTDPATYTDPSRPKPNVLQILFSSATGEDPFSPVLELDQTPRAQLAAVSFDDTNTDPSIAYVIGNDPVPGWQVQWHLEDGDPAREVLDLGQTGRFKFRALLTVGIPGQMARFYRTDPEMVIGPPGGGGLRDAHSSPATARR